MMVVYRHCQHTFQYNQLEKAHVRLYDPLKDDWHAITQPGQLPQMLCPEAVMR